MLPRGVPTGMTERVRLLLYLVVLVVVVHRSEAGECARIDCALYTHKHACSEALWWTMWHVRPTLFYDRRMCFRLRRHHPGDVLCMRKERYD